MDTVLGAILPAAMILAFPLWLVDMVGYVRNRNYDALLKNLLGLIGSFIALWTVAQTRWAGEVKIGTDTLEGMAVVELIVVAFGIIAVSSGLIIRTIKARDSTQTAASPELIKPTEGQGSHDTVPDLSGYFPPTE